MGSIMGGTIARLNWVERSWLEVVTRVTGLHERREWKTVDAALIGIEDQTKDLEPSEEQWIIVLDVER